MAIAATAIVEARARAEEIWADSQAVKSRGYLPAMRILLAILATQTANFDELKNRKNCGKVKVTWENSCPGEASVTVGIQKINSFLCDITGVGPSTTIAEYGISKAVKSAGFAITDDNCGNIYDNIELVARGLLDQHYQIVEKLCKMILSGLVSFAGANSYLGNNGLITASAGNLYKFSSYDAVASTLVPYILRAAQANNMSNPVLYQGDALYNNFYIDAKQENTPADSGYMKMWRDLSVVEDFKTFNALNMNDNVLVVDSGAVALVTKYTGGPTPTTLKADYYLTTMPLMGGLIRVQNANGVLEPLYVDIYQKRQSVVVETIGTETRCVMADTYQAELKYDFLLNPTACAAGYTGVINMKKDATLPAVGVPATFAQVPVATGKTYQVVS